MKGAREVVLSRNMTIALVETECQMENYERRLLLVLWNREFDDGILEISTVHNN